MISLYCRRQLAGTMTGELQGVYWQPSIADGHSLSAHQKKKKIIRKGKKQLDGADSKKNI